jgi:hypothetical protein
VGLLVGMMQGYAVDAIGKRCEGVIVAGGLTCDPQARFRIVSHEIGGGSKLTIFGPANRFPLPKNH